MAQRFARHSLGVLGVSGSGACFDGGSGGMPSSTGKPRWYLQLGAAGGRTAAKAALMGESSKEPFCVFSGVRPPWLHGVLALHNPQWGTAANSSACEHEGDRLRARAADGRPRGGGGGSGLQRQSQPRIGVVVCRRRIVAVAPQCHVQYHRLICCLMSTEECLVSTVDCLLQS